MAELTRSRLQGLVNITKRPNMFLRDTFFTNVVRFDTAKVELDLDIEVRAMAEYSQRGAVSKTVNKDPFKTNTYTPPYISLNEVIDEKTFQNRVPGQSSDSTTAMSAKEYATLKALRKLDDMVSRREEYQCMEALFSGSVSVGADTISFGRDSALNVTLAGGEKWDQGSPKIYDKLIEWRDLIAEKSGLAPVGNIILGLDAWKHMRGNAEFMGFLDKLRINIGTIEPVRVGAAYRVMSLPEIGDFWVYPEFYVDPADKQTKKLIPADKIAYVAAQPGFTRLYGGVATAQGDQIMVVPGDRVVYTDLRKDPAAELIVMQSAPLMQLTNPNAVLSADVV